jgi:TPR repeat protein
MTCLGSGPVLIAQQKDTEEFRQAMAKAQTGDPDAQVKVALCFALAKGTQLDQVEAAKWFLKSAEQGLAPAQLLLADCYAFGKGVQQDIAEAAKWYRMAAEQRIAIAQYNLGKCYQKGEGVPRDPGDAAKWFRAAADQGFADAQLALAMSYRHGTGVPEDHAAAANWFRKAADQGEALSQTCLGMSFADGDGVAQNDQEAYIWLSLAAARGNKNAAHLRDQVAGRMSRAEIVEGQQRAASFVEKKCAPPDAPDPEPGASPPLDNNQPKASGTGAFISGNGFLVTCAHVVEGATKVRVVTTAGPLPAKVVKIDSANDLALLKAEGTFSALPLASSRSVRLGSTVATVGFPMIDLQGFAPKLAKGEIASLSGAGDDARYFQISLPIQPGNSGGALVDERGNAIGIVSAKLSARAALSTSGVLPENVNYAVKSSYLLSFLESMPEVAARLKDPETKDRRFEDVVRSSEQAAVLVLVY